MYYEHIKYQNRPKIQCFAVMINNRMAHFHNDLELLYVLDGTVCVECKGKTYTLHTQDILILDRNEVHCLHRTNEDNLLLALQFDPSDMMELSPKFMGIRLIKHLYSVSDGEQYTALKQLFITILNHYTVQDPSLPLKKMQLICDICILLSEKLDSIVLSDQRLARETQNNHRLIEIMDYINQNYTNHLSLNQTANQFGLSAPYLSRLFKENIGVTFSQYLARTRVHRAAQMIAGSPQNLLDICMACGFSTLHYFNKAFYAEFSCKPSEYRGATKTIKYYFFTPQEKEDGSTEHIIIDVRPFLDYLQNPSKTVLLSSFPEIAPSNVMTSHAP